MVHVHVRTVLYMLMLPLFGSHVIVEGTRTFWLYDTVGNDPKGVVSTCRRFLEDISGRRQQHMSAASQRLLLSSSVPWNKQGCVLGGFLA
jgi:hypothetical protein